MGPPSYMRSFVDRNVVMRRIHVFYSPVNPKQIFGTPCNVSVDIAYGRHILFLFFFFSVQPVSVAT